MDQAEAIRFVAEWERAWNAHDLDSLLGHLSDAVVYTSPVAAQILPGCDGVIHGKEALRRYWADGLRRIPDLRFEVEAVYAGVRTIVISYRNQAGGRVCEALTFDGPSVVAGDATYLSDDAARADSGASAG